MILLTGYSERSCLSKPNLSLGSKPCSEAKIDVPSHHPKILSTKSNCRSRGLRARDTLDRQAGMSAWEPWGARKQDLLFVLGPKSMACFLTAGSLGTDSQPHTLLLAAFMSHCCATEWRCQLATLPGADTLTSPYEDTGTSAKFHPKPRKDGKTSSEPDECI